MTHRIRPERRRQAPRAGGCPVAGARMDELEARILLDSAPVFDTPFEAQYFTNSGAITIPINGYDADVDDVLAITVEANHDLVTATVPTGNSFANLNFETAAGAAVGFIQVELFDGRAPLAAERFVTLATNYVYPNGMLDPDGVPFYTDVPVYRVVNDFMFQTGDAEKQDGEGGSPLGTFADEFVDSLRFAWRGVLAMANRPGEPDSNDCQFFLTDERTPWLDDAHTIFGQVIDGWDVYDTIITSNDDDYVLASVTGGWTGQDGTVTVVAPEGFNGNVEVTVTLTDPAENEVQQSFTVVFLNAVPPVLSHIPHNVDAGSFGALDCFRAGDLLYVADGWAGLVIYDVSDPTSPVELDTYDTPGGAWAVTVRGTVAWVADFDGGLIALDVADPSDIGFLGAGRPAVIGAGGSYALGVALYGDYAFVPEYVDGLTIYYIADPQNITPVRTIVEIAEGGLELQWVVDVAMYGSYLLVSDNGGAVVVIDVANPLAPAVVTYTNAPTAPWGIAVEGNLLYVADMADGLRVIDISDPANPDPLGLLPMGAAPRMLAVHNGMVVVGRNANSSCVIVDATDPDNMAVLYYFDVGGVAGRPCYGEDFWALPDQYDGVQLVRGALFAPIMHLNPAAQEQVPQDSRYFIEWIGGKPGAVASVYVLSPTGWRLLQADVPSLQGFHEWDTTGQVPGWYWVATIVWNGTTRAWPPVSGRGWLEITPAGSGAAAGATAAASAAGTGAASPADQPAVEFLAPLPGQQVVRGEPVEIAFNTGLVADQSPKVTIWLLSDQAPPVPLGTVLAGAVGSYVWDTTGAAPGWYAFAAELEGFDGLSDSSEWLRVV